MSIKENSFYSLKKLPTAKKNIQAVFMVLLFQKILYDNNYWLVEHGCVGVPVLLNDGDDEHDEFGPEVQVLDARTLLLQRDLVLVLWLEKKLITKNRPDRSSTQSV